MDTLAELSAFGLERDLTTYASCFEGLRGSRLAIKVCRCAWRVHEHSPKRS